MSSIRRAEATVVVPVRGESDLLRGALAALAAQDVGQAAFDVIVVDDDPGCTAAVESPVRVFRSGGRGPYTARNVGWRASDADIVLFCDVRSRPRPDWVRRTLAAFQSDDVALVGSEVRVVRGTSWGARAVAYQEPFRLQNYIGLADTRPYLPNCNLAVRRSDLEAVGGYPEVRSGGDAELCWQVLDRPGRRLTTIPDVLMDWVPRQGFLEYLRQNHRYGRSYVQLSARWDIRPGETWSYWRLAKRSVRVTLRVLSGVVRRRGLDQELAEAGRLALLSGARREQRS